MNTVDGWLSDIDAKLIDGMLQAQEAAGVHGDLLEIGAYRGKSAVLIGYHCRDDEDFVVVDPFDAVVADDADNLAENVRTYGDLSKAQFTSNYARFHDRPATVVEALSSDLPEHVGDRQFRFIHLDGSHAYDVVAEDIRMIHKFAADGAVIVFDDVRSQHTPGVSAAVWQAMREEQLIPLVYGSDKLYATFGPAEGVSWASDVARELCHTAVETVDGHPVEILMYAHGYQEQGHPVARDWLPPAVLRMLRNLRNRRALRR